MRTKTALDGAYFPDRPPQPTSLWWPLVPVVVIQLARRPHQLVAHQQRCNPRLARRQGDCGSTALGILPHPLGGLREEIASVINHQTSSTKLPSDSRWNGQRLYVYIPCIHTVESSLRTGTIATHRPGHWAPRLVSGARTSIPHKRHRSQLRWKTYTVKSDTNGSHQLKKCRPCFTRDPPTRRAYCVSGGAYLRASAARSAARSAGRRDARGVCLLPPWERGAGYARGGARARSRRTQADVAGLDAATRSAAR